MLKLIDYRTHKLLATVKRAELNKWCDANGYLPHHWGRVSGERALIVISI